MDRHASHPEVSTESTDRVASFPRLGPGSTREEILEIVQTGPHFLFVEAVLEASPSRLVTRGSFPESSPFHRGKKPGDRLLPGTILTELSIQSAEILIHNLRGPTLPEEGIPVLVRIQQGRFRRMVRPGDTLTCHVELEHVLGKRYDVKVRIDVAGVAVMTGRLGMAATGSIHSS